VKRAPLVVVAGAAGLVGVLGLHSRGTPLLLTRSHPASSTGRPSGPTSSGSRLASGTVTGPVEQYGYGELAVKVTASGGRITDVSVATLQTAESYSQSIAQQVIPMLRNEVLSVQGAQINGISGATYTSEAYAYSVQGALDRLRRA
jgi:uncharacterized protein with FMN-binding domain